MKWIVALRALMLLAPAGARAAPPTCTIQTSSVSFGIVVPFLPSTSTSGSVNVSCSGLTLGYTIALKNGLHFSTPLRRMASSGNFLTYQLFQDSAATIVWGNGTTGPKVTCPSGSCNGNLQYPVTGQYQSGQNAIVGIYNDTITVTVAY
jgi:spore coat protein U-like protein